MSIIDSILGNKTRAFNKISGCFRKSSSSIGGPRLGVLGVAFNRGQKSNVGVEYGPEVIRTTNFVRALEDELGYVVNDYGNIHPPHPTKETLTNNVRNPEIVGQICEKVSLKVQEIYQNGDPLLTLGGDHSISIGTINGHSSVQPDLCLINVGAHADMNTAATSKTHNLNGMANSFHVIELEPCKTLLPGFEWMRPTLRAKDVAFIGLRDVDPLERLIFEKHGIKFFSMHDVDRLGMFEVTKRALDAINIKDVPSLVYRDVQSLVYRDVQSLVYRDVQSLVYRDVPSLVYRDVLSLVYRDVQNLGWLESGLQEFPVYRDVQNLVYLRVTCIQGCPESSYRISSLQGWLESGLPRCPESSLPAFLVYKNVQNLGCPKSGLQGCPKSGLQENPKSGLQDVLSLVYRDVQNLGCPKSGLQRCPESGLQGCPKSGSQGCLEFSLQEYPVSGLQGCPGSVLQGCLESSLQGCPKSSLKGCPESGLQKFLECKDVQNLVTKVSSLQGWLDFGLQEFPVYRDVQNLEFLVYRDVQNLVTGFPVYRDGMSESGLQEFLVYRDVQNLGCSKSGLQGCPKSGLQGCPESGLHVDPIYRNDQNLVLCVFALQGCPKSGLQGCPKSSLQGCPESGLQKFLECRDVQNLVTKVSSLQGWLDFGLQEFPVYRDVQNLVYLSFCFTGRNRPIHISFDIDAYDINVAPSTAIGFPGGLTLREGLTFAEEIASTGLLTGLDIVEVNTKVGQTMDQEKTLCAVRDTILAFCGSSRGGNLPINAKNIPIEIAKN
uniref:Arginase n=1 Tax=Strigamia maritima TaxID=126957 RepID=T1J6L7_STRMM